MDADGVSEPSQPRSQDAKMWPGLVLDFGFWLENEDCLSYVQGSFSSIDNIEIYFIACFGFIFFSLAKG